MPGRNSADNALGWTKFVVGSVLGQGCLYDSVQTAIDDCFAAGGGVVLVRTGTYVENLIFRSGVDLYGSDADGRLPPVLSHVVIQGNHSFTSSGAVFDAVICQNITFSCLTGDCITLNADTGAQCIFALKFCGVDATTDPASRGVVLNPDGTSACQFATDNSNCNASSHLIEAIGAGAASASLLLGDANSGAGDAFHAGSGSCSLEVANLNISANGSIYNGVVAGGNFNSFGCRLFSGNEIVLFSGGGGTANVIDTFISSGSPSGFWIDGTGSLFDAGVALNTTSPTPIGAAITETPLDWQPYARAGAAPGTGTSRGTACFDNSQFTVTDGFVQVIGGPNLVWTDQNASTSVASFSGSFVIATITLTLPATPAQGDLVEFKVDGAFVLTIQASGTQLIKMGNQVSSAGGTAVSTLDGDAVALTYRAASDSWIANSLIGNWNLT